MGFGEARTARNFWTELGIVLLCFLSYLVVALWAFRQTGTGAVCNMAIIPIIFLSWRHGPFVGTFLAVAFFVVTGATFMGQAAPGEDLAPKGSEPWIGLGLWILISILAGTVSRLAHRLVKELEDRRKLEAELRSSRDHLEVTVAIRSRELEAARDSMIRSEKVQALGMLASGLAHDFNNQLTVILGHAEVLLGRLEAQQQAQGQAPDLARHVRQIRQSGQDASELTNGLLSFVRHGRMRTEPVDVHELLENSLRMVRPTLKPGIHLSLVTNATRSLVCGDPGRIKNALLNLILNARDAVGRIGEIEVVTQDVLEDDTSLLVIEVKDSGSGIPSEHLARLFEPFFTTKPEGVGTGLGLANVQITAQAHGGRVEAGNRPEGGAYFRLFLPSQEGSVSTAKSTVEVARLPKGTRVLLIDDEEAVGEVLEEMLQLIGADVIRFRDPGRALAWFQRSSRDCDVCIVDLNMPGMDGLETIQALHVVLPELPALLLSGSVLDEAQSTLASKHVYATVAKPCRVEELQDLIGRALRSAVHS